MRTLKNALCCAVAALVTAGAMAQVPAAPPGAPAAAPPGLPPGFRLPPPTPNDTLVSPLLNADGSVTLSLYAPLAQKVTLAGDLVAFGAPEVVLNRADNGVWSVTVKPGPGTFRYAFVADGAITLDSKNTETSRSQTSTRSLVHVPGHAYEDLAAVPHGAVAAIDYPSTTFSSPRRMHIYTPPGYAAGKTIQRYPVLYLLHGGGDSDDSWWTVGRAGQILDNLIAAGKARPMIVVMPAGHVPASDGTVGGASNAMSEDPANDRFTDDFLNNVIPYVENNYRTTHERALAGLSMGGLQAANIGLLHTNLFPSVLIYSSGWFPDVLVKFEQKWGATLDKDAKQLRLLWVGYGETDIARPNAEAMLKMFDRHGLTYQSEMTPGGHEWANWRLYLSQTAPLLFKPR